MDTLYIRLLQLSGNKMPLAKYCCKVFNAKYKSATSAGHKFYTMEMVAFIDKAVKIWNSWDDANTDYKAWKINEDKHAAECFFAGGVCWNAN